MIDIVVFGKPRSFESFEFEFDGQHLSNPRNTHPEPIVKHPDTSWGPIYHYFKRDGIDGLELYAPCEGFDSDRPGIIFGVGLKSNHDFELSKTIDLLTRYWGDLATAFIDGNNKFITSTIVDTLHNTEWSEEEVSDIRNTIKPNTLANTKIKKELLLLVANDITEIENAEMSIKQYADVYIANDTSLFRDLINRTVFEKQARGRIHSVTDGKIVVIADASIQDKKRRNLPGFSTKPQKTSAVHSSDKTSSSEQSNRGADAETENDSDSTSDNSNKNLVKSEGGANAATNDKNKELLEKKRKKKKRRIITAIVLIAILVGAGVFFKPKPADRIELEIAPTTGYIFDGFNLHPTLYHGNSKKTSTDLKDITWKIEGDGMRYIRIMDNNEIAIDPVFNTEKPRQDQSVTVIAYYKERELGRETYTLEKYVLPKANKVDFSSYPNPIKEWFRIDPKLSFNGEQDVSTKREELRFKVEPEGFAKIEKIDNEYRLIVTNRPENDTPVTVIAYLDEQQIGQQTYTIAKKETINVPNPSVNVDGKILCRRKSDVDNSPYQSLSTFSTREITNYNFFALDKNNGKLIGQWKCIGYELQKAKQSQNPVNFAQSPNPGNYKLEYWVGNQKRASIDITITEQ